MQKFLLFASLGTGLALLVGCSESSAPASPENRPTKPQSSATPASGATAGASNAASPAEAVAQVAQAVLGDQAKNLQPESPGVPPTGSNAPVAAQVLHEVAKGKEADWSGLVKSLAANHSDQLLGGLGGDLGKIATTLKQSLENRKDLSTTVDSAVRAVLKDQHSEALALYDKLSAARLTPGQQKLLAEVKNLTAAFWVQKDLSALDGAQGKVASVVKALRQGDVTAALPTLKELAQNAALTPRQKELLGVLVKEYAPSVAEAAETVKKKLPALPAGLKPGQ
jgi:hypothetical protein